MQVERDKSNLFRSQRTTVCIQPLQLRALAMHGQRSFRLALFKYQYNIYLALVKFQMIFARDMVHIVN